MSSSHLFTYEVLPELAFLVEKSKKMWHFCELDLELWASGLAWNDLQSRSFFVQSYPEFPHLRGMLGASQKNDLKSYLLIMYPSLKISTTGTAILWTHSDVTLTPHFSVVLVADNWFKIQRHLPSCGFNVTSKFGGQSWLSWDSTLYKLTGFSKKFKIYWKNYFSRQVRMIVKNYICS